MSPVRFQASVGSVCLSQAILVKLGGKAAEHDFILRECLGWCRMCFGCTRPCSCRRGCCGSSCRSDLISARVLLRVFWKELGSPRSQRGRVTNRFLQMGRLVAWGQGDVRQRLFVELRPYQHERLRRLQMQLRWCLRACLKISFGESR